MVGRVNLEETCMSQPARIEWVPQTARDPLEMGCLVLLGGTRFSFFDIKLKESNQKPTFLWFGGGEFPHLETNTRC